MRKASDATQLLRSLSSIPVLILDPVLVPVLDPDLEPVLDPVSILPPTIAPSRSLLSRRAATAPAHSTT